ncbi:hypothetical protein [Paenibacillus lautus]|uniref:hypothetical protein n=1 Tax=Paenibacillus lautus TaxID=1401 RepID=UPI002DBC3B2E|nr:hypothetical protein [Paenibacillus lautus]MEC0255885.1 hypothetical protein [Paenibacillus lautus]
MTKPKSSCIFHKKVNRILFILVMLKDASCRLVLLPGDLETKQRTARAKSTLPIVCWSKLLDYSDLFQRS